MPATLLDRIDEFAETNGYSGRSEVIRDASRSLMAERPGEADGTTLLGVATVLFDSRDGGADEALSTLASEYDDVVVETTRTRVDDHYWMATFTLSGDPGAVDSLLAEARGTTGVHTVEHSLTAVDSVLD